VHRPDPSCPFLRWATSASARPAIRSGRRTKAQIRTKKVAEIETHSATVQKSLFAVGWMGVGRARGLDNPRLASLFELRWWSGPKTLGGRLASRALARITSPLRVRFVLKPQRFNCSGILGGSSQVQNGRDDDSCAMDALENPVLKAMHQRPPEFASVNRSGSEQLSHSGQGRPDFDLEAVPQPGKRSS